MKLKIFLMGILLLILQACAGIPRYAVDIDSINGPGAEAKDRYILLPGEEGVDSGNLQFKEYAAYVERALNSKGFGKADSIDDADIAVYLSYGIGDPQEHQYIYSYPVWGQTGFVTSYNYIKIDDNGNYRAVESYTPVYGIIDSDIRTGTTVTYQRFIILDALDLKASEDSEKNIQLWQTTITSTGSNDDLRVVFPIMIGAATDYIGTDTGKKVRVTLFEDDERVLEVKGIDQ